MDRERGERRTVGGHIREIPKSVAQGAAGAASSGLRGLQMEVERARDVHGGEARDPREGLLYRAGEAVEDLAPEVHEDYQGTFAQDAAAGLGSMGFYVAMSTAGRGAGLRGMAQHAPAVTAGTVSGEDQAFQNYMEWMKENGMEDPMEALDHASQGRIYGAVQVASVVSVLRPMTGSIGSQTLRRTLESAGNEWTVENLGMAGQNMLQRQYDPEHPIWEEIPDSGNTAAVGAAIMGLLVGGLTRGKAGPGGGVSSADTQGESEQGETEASRIARALDRHGFDLDDLVGPVDDADEAIEVINQKYDTTGESPARQAPPTSEPATVDDVVRKVHESGGQAKPWEQSEAGAVVADVQRKVRDQVQDVAQETHRPGDSLMADSAPVEVPSADVGDVPAWGMEPGVSPDYGLDQRQALEQTGAMGQEAQEIERERRRAERVEQARMRGKDQAAKRRQVDPERDDLILAIRKLGGINTDLETDWAGRLHGLDALNRQPGIPSVERGDQGRSLDDLAEVLHELGYLQSRDASELHGALSQAEGGENIPMSMQANMDRMLEEELATREQRDRDADRYDPETEGPTIQDLEEYADMVRRQEQSWEDVLTPDQERAHTDLLDRLIESAQAAGVTAEQVESILEKPDESGVAEALVQAAAEALNVRRTAEAHQEEAGEPGQVEGEAPEFTLETHTPADVEARQEAERQRQEAEREEDQRQQAEQELGSFTLTGSDRQVDVVEATTGQRNLFDRPAEPKAKTPDPTPKKEEFKPTHKFTHNGEDVGVMIPDDGTDFGFIVNTMGTVSRLKLTPKVRETLRPVGEAEAQPEQGVESGATPAPVEDAAEPQQVEGQASPGESREEAAAQPEEAKAPGTAMEQAQALDDEGIDALIREVMDEGRTPETSKPEKKRAKTGTTKTGKRTVRKRKSPAESADTRKASQDRLASEVAKSMGKNVAGALGDAIKGIDELFGGPGTLRSGLSFSEEQYQKAKPYFQDAFNKINEAGKDFKDFVRILVNHYGDGISPYIKRFVKDLKEEASDESRGTAVQDTDQEAEPGDSRDRMGGGVEAGDRHDSGLATEQAEDGGETGEAGGAAGVRPRDGVPEDRSGTREHEGGDATGGSGDGSRGGVVSDGAGGRGRGERTDAGQPEHLEQRAENYHIQDPDALLATTPKKRFEKNRRAIEVYRELRDEDRPPTAEERDTLAGYIGWGSFGQELFQGTWDRPRYKDGWKEENDWLRSHLGKDEWQAAQASIINAHYTDPPTVTAIWDLVERLGFNGGRVLEPSMGVGNFFGLMPRHLEGKSKLTGIELDSLTAGMAKILYPGANVRHMGYQESKTPDNYYDLVIGNWPFGKSGPADRAYSHLKYSLHDYFFLKALDQVRPGGLVVGITSRFTMDGRAKQVRSELAKKADLVGAIRLPSGAFDQYAGTSVVTDIVVLKKRKETNNQPSGWIESERWPGLEDADNPVNVNEYYHANPNMILGEMGYGHGTTYGRAGAIVTPPADIEAALKTAIERFPEAVMEPDAAPDRISYVANTTEDGVNSVIVGDDGGLFVSFGDQMAPLNEIVGYTVKSGKTTREREQQIKDLVGIRKAYGALMDAERKGDAKTEAKRKELKRAYTDFVKQYGPINDSYALKVLKKAKDPARPALQALETRDGDTWKPMPVLDRPATRARTQPKNPTVQDAFVLERNKGLYIDMDAIAEKAGTSTEEAAKTLIESGAVFALPGGGYESSDVYLSGNVRRKLREAKEAKEEGEDMDRNIQALEEVIPPDVPYSSIEAKLGAQWISEKYYRDFVAEALAGRPELADQITVKWSGTRWKVEIPYEVRQSQSAQALESVVAYRQDAVTGKQVLVDSGNVPLQKLFEAAINNRTMKFTRKNEDGSTSPREEFTQAANERATSIREKFEEWLWQSPDRKIPLEKDYNEIMNANADTRFDGSFLTFDGMMLEKGENQFNLRQHQVNAIWRGLVMGSGIYGHEVGTGKSYTIGGIAIESRRFGIARKPLILGHNANSATLAHEIQEMYPGARVLYVDNLTPSTIDVTLRQIAHDDWDAVVMPHSLLDRLALSRDTLMELARDEIQVIEDEFIEIMEESGGGASVAMMDDPDAIKKLRVPTAKELVKIRRSILDNIEKQAQRASRENAVTVEELGVDMVLVDEAHIFKKPPFATRMQMKGLQKETSDRSVALKFLTDYVKRQNDGKGVHLFTGTPITNTLTELFHLQRYVMQSEMRKDGVGEWDTWFNTFAAGISDIEYTSTGEFRPITRLSGFVNVPELRRTMNPYMDIVFADDMPEFKPRSTSTGKTITDDLTDAELDELLNGRTENPVGRPYKKVVMDVAEMTPAQTAVLAEQREYARQWDDASGKERMEWMRSGAPQSPILIDGVMHRVGMDARLVDSNYEDHENSKSSRVVRRVLHHYKTEEKSAQVIFMETGFSDTKEVQKTKVPTLNLQKEIVRKLVEGGIPEKQIAVVTGGMKPETKKAIADKVNSLEIRVVIGQTETLGTGVNMQANLRAMHHLDAPHMPGQLEQRNGRGWRQGNAWNTVMEYRYLTEKIDGKRWQTLSIKDRFIKSFLRAGAKDRVIEGDATQDESSYTDTLSEALGDPRVLMRQKLQGDLKKLLRKERTHLQGVEDAKENIKLLEKRNKRFAKEAEAAEQDAEVYRKAVEAAEEAQQERYREAVAVYVESLVELTPEQREAIKRNGWGNNQKDRELAARVQKAVKEAEEKGNNRPKAPTARGFHAVVNGKEVTSKDGFDSLIQTVKAGDSWAAVGEVMGFPLEVKSSTLSKDRALARLRSKANPEVIYDPGAWGDVTAENLVSEVRSLGREAQRLNTLIEENKRDIPKLEEMARMPFNREAELKAKQKRLADLEADLARNPNPPPAWLRSGAPVGSMVHYQGKPYVVEGHTWDEDGYRVLLDMDGSMVEVDYLEVRDDSGLQVYDEQPFVAPGEVSAVPVERAEPNADAVLYQGQTDALVGQGTIDPDSMEWSGEGNWHILTPDLRAYDNVPEEGFETEEALDSFMRQFTDFADFSKGPRGDGISVTEAKRILGPIMARQNVPTHIFRTPEEAAEKSGIFVPESSLGMYYRGAMYLISGSHADALALEGTLWHETLHAGMAAIYRGKSNGDYINAMNQIRLMNKGINRAALVWRRKHGDDLRARLRERGLTGKTAEMVILSRATEEALAELSQAQGANIRLKGLRKFIKRIAAFMRERGFTRLANFVENTTNAHALTMIVQAREMVMDGEAAVFREHTADRSMGGEGLPGVPSDADYMDAVRSGDMDSAREMVERAAHASGVRTFNDPDVTAFSVRRKPAPKKTVKAYKAFRMEGGRLRPLYVGATDEIPMGVWLDAKEGGFKFRGPDVVDRKTGKREPGLWYVTGSTGKSVRMDSLPEESQRILKENGIDTRWVKLLAYRPGWHTGSLPYNPQGAGAIDKHWVKGEPTKDHPYRHALYPDVVIAEVELSADVDFQGEYESSAVRKSDGSINVAASGLRRIPEDGAYTYTTNANNKAEPGEWMIGGSIKVNRLLSQAEADAKMEKEGAFPQKRIGGPLDLTALGYQPGANDASFTKLLDPVTFDDAGRVIPLSERFNPDMADPRYAQEGGLPGTTGDLADFDPLTSGRLPDTMEVDGTQRQTRNSEGQPIADTEEGVRNFWRWFGDSQVVDSRGRPLVVYHGTETHGFNTFEQRGENDGYFFTTEKALAEGFAGNFGRTMGAYLAIKKPADQRDNPDAFEDFMAGGAHRKALMGQGHDGAIITEPEGDHALGDETVYIAFNPEQIKSATENRGTFDPKDPDIRFSMGPPAHHDQGIFSQGQPLDRAIRNVLVPFRSMRDSKGRFIPGVKATERAGRILKDAKFREDGFLDFMNPILETARAGLIDRYKLSDEFKQREATAMAEESRIINMGRDFLKAIEASGMSAQELKVLQGVLAEGDLASEDMARLAEPIRNAVDDFGQQLVSLGLLNPESYHRNLGRYLHRSYMKYETHNMTVPRWARNMVARSRKKIYGDELRARGLKRDVTMERLLRDTPDDWWGRKMKKGEADKQFHGTKWHIFDRMDGTEGTGTFEGMEPGGPRKPRVRQRVYLPADRPVPPKYQAWTNRGLWEITGTEGGKYRLRRDFTREEREQMGEILDVRYNIIKTFQLLSHDIAYGKFFKDIASNPEWATREPGNMKLVADAMQATRSGTFAGYEWVKVPTSTIEGSRGQDGKATPKWGALAGMYVRPEVWRDLNELDRMQTGTGTWQFLLTQWKLNKALALDTPIPTPDGWTTMGEIREGDEVFDEKGQVCQVLEVKEVQHGRPCYRVEFSDGTSIVADDEHWWFTTTPLDRRNGKPGEVRTTKEIRETLTYGKRKDSRHSISVTEPLDLPVADLPIHPYVLGAWLGDGFSNDAQMCAGGRDADEIIKHLSDVGVECYEPRVRETGVWLFTLRNGEKSRKEIIRPRLRRLNVLNNKHIPQSYLRASREQRLELLRGLMDTDGWITANGDCGFSSSIPAIRDGALELLRSLGYKPTASEVMASLNGEETRPSWRIHFKAYAEQPVFKLARKKERLRGRKVRRLRSGVRYITAVTPVQSVPVRCIAVSSESHLYLAGESMIATHNTARSPVVHLNNVMSNFVLMDLIDVRLQDLRRGIAEYRSGGELYRLAVDHGAFGGSFANIELQRNEIQPMLDEILKQAQESRDDADGRMRFFSRMGYTIWKGLKNADARMTEAYQIEDTVFRMATFMRHLSLGASHQEAAMLAREQFLNYDIRAPWVNAARRSVLPFISYTYRAVPAVATAIAHRPWKLAKYIFMGYMANMLAFALSEGDEEEERRTMRDPMQAMTWMSIPFSDIGVHRMLRLPWDDKHGNPVYQDIMRYVPIGDVFDTNQGQIGVPAWLQTGGPLMMGAEIILNRSAFTGRDIVDPLTDTGWSAAQKRMDYLWKAWMPSAAYVPGSWHFDKAWAAATGERDILERPYSLPAALASGVGVKVQPHDVQLGYYFRGSEIQRRKRALMGELRMIARDEMRNIGTEASRESDRKRIMKQLEALQEEARRLQGEG